MQLTKPYSADQIQAWLTAHAGQEIFRPGLERLRPYISPYQEWIEQEKIQVITIAGTNGKGETAHKLAYLLKIKNISYTLWTSPHILSMTERFSSDLGDISPDFLGELFVLKSQQVKNLSYFEFIFLIFMEYTRQLKPKVIILEVGLGGLFDAANCISSNLNAITSVSRDHQEILGNRYDKILQDKWGITRKNVQLVTSFELVYLQELAASWAKSQNIPWIDLFKQKILGQHVLFSERNEVMAKTLFSYLSGESVESLGDVKFPSLLARGEVVKWKQHQFKFLGSHNPDGMRKLIQYLSESGEGFDAILVSFSKRNQKDLNSMAKILFTLKHKNILLTQFDHPKSADVRRLMEEFSEFKFVDWKQYLQNLSESKNSSQKILVTGSYYFVGEVQKHFF